MNETPDFPADIDPEIVSEPAPAPKVCPVDGNPVPHDAPVCPVCGN